MAPHKLNLPVGLVGIPFTLYCRCRCAAPPPAADRASLQRAPGQPAVSQERDRNIWTPFCHKYYSGRRGDPPRLQMQADAVTNQTLSLFPSEFPHSGPDGARSGRTASHTRTGRTHDRARTARRIKDAPSR